MARRAAMTVIRSAGVCLLIPCIAAARVWEVHHDGSGDASTIQAAVDGAENGDVIVIGPGAYDEIVVVNGKSLELRSTHGPNATSIRVFGGQNQGSALSQVRVSGLTMAPRGINSAPLFVGPLEYFEVSDCIFTSGTYTSELYKVRHAVVRDCVFHDNIDTNSGDLGGGALKMRTTLASTGYLVDNCVFRNNEVTTGTPGMGFGGGGAIAASGVDGGPIEIRNCLFDANRAPTAGACFVSGSVIVTNCTFVNNVSSDAAVVMETPPQDPWGVFNSIFAYNSLVGLYSPAPSHCGCNAFWQNDILGLEGACSKLEEEGWGGFWELDPAFCDSTGDYRLAKSSPLVGPFVDQEHSQCTSPIGAYGPGCAPVPVIDTSWGRIKARF